MKKKGNKENIAYFYYTLELYYIELDVFVCMHKLNFYHRPMPIIIFMEVLLDDESLSLINLYNFHSPQVTSNAYTVSRIMSMCRTKRFIFKYVLIITFTSNKKKKKHDVGIKAAPLSKNADLNYKEPMIRMYPDCNDPIYDWLIHNNKMIDTNLHAVNSSK